MLLVAGCQTPPPPTFQDILPLIPGPGTANYSTNLLQPGDTIGIIFQYSTNFNTVQKITLNGVLNLETVGEVKAAGQTPLQLQAELVKLYKPQIKDDVVTVRLIASVASVYICGAVFHPGKVAIERPMTAMEAVMEAGGFDPNRAQLSGVTVVRIKDGKQKTYHVNLKKVLSGEETAPFYLSPFDIIYVPTKTFNF